MNYDGTLKDLVWAGAPALMRELVGAPVATLLPTEYTAIRSRRPDMVAQLADGRIYHLELQAGPDGQMPWRMLEYYLLLARHHGTVIVQQVLQVGERGGAIASGIAHPDLQFRYSVTDIRSVEPGPLLASPEIEDNVLAFLCRCDDLQSHIRRILAQIRRHPRPRRQEAVARLVLLSGLRDAERVVLEEVKAMAIQIEIESSPFLRDILNRGRTEGRAEGRSEGQTEGRTEGLAASLLRLLRRRFGVVPPEVEDHIRQADPSAIERWFDRAIEAPTLEAVFEPTAGSAAN